MVQSRAAGVRIPVLISPLVLALLAWPAVGRAAPGDTELVSVATNGTAAGLVAEWDDTAAVSADGRFVAFISYASNLVPGDTTGDADVFVRDRLNGTIERVSVSSTGTQANGPSEFVDISGDGRYVAFASVASNLVANDTNGQSDIFVHDRATGATRRVSVSATGVQSNGYSSNPRISRDGQVVGFMSYATNLVPNDSNRENDVFVHVIGSGVTERVSVSSSEQQGTGGSNLPSLSSDGRFVAFASGVATLVAGDTNSYADVFVRDRLNGVTERVSLNSAGVQGDRSSRRPSISGNGRYVAFESEALNLAGNEGSSWGSDVFVRDRATGQTELISVGSSPTRSFEANYFPEISADGRYVVFTSGVPDLVDGDSNEFYDVFWRDRVTGTTERASVATNGAQANEGSTFGALSADGLHVAVVSKATNLTAGDSNTTADVYLHEPGGPVTGPETIRWSLLPKFQSFGEQTVDTFRWRRFALENLGNVPLPLSANLIGRDASSFKLRNDCGSAVPVGQTCFIRIAFHPMTTGDKVAQLRVIAGKGEVRDRPLSGTGVAASFTVSPTSIPFGGVPVGSASDARIITITNTGRGWLPIRSIELDGARPGQFTRYDACRSTAGRRPVVRRDGLFRAELKGPAARRCSS